MACDDFEHLVAGDALPTTMGQFKLRAARIIKEEQAKPNPDNMLIGFACDAMRLAREHGNFYHTTLDTLVAAMERKRQSRSSVHGDAEISSDREKDARTEEHSSGMQIEQGRR